MNFKKREDPEKIIGKPKRRPSRFPDRYGSIQYHIHKVSWSITRLIRWVKRRDDNFS